MPSWAHWRRAMLLSELRREQGMPAHRGEGKRSLNPGRVGYKKWSVATRNGWEGTDGVPASRSLPGVAHLLLRC